MNFQKYIKVAVEIFKLRNKSAEGVLDLIDEEGRIASLSQNQFLPANDKLIGGKTYVLINITGKLSSNENLC